MALNPLSDMSFNGEDWTNDTLYPTYEGSEDKVRADLNRMHFIMRNFLNDNIIPTLNQIIDIIGDAVTIAVPDGSITHAKLSAVGSEPGPAVALDNMQANSVGTEQLVNDSVTAAKIADGAIQRGHLASGAVGPGNLSQGAVLETNMAQNSVNTNALIDLCVATAKLAAKAVTTAKIDDGAVTAGQLATDAVETAKIKDLNVTTAKLAAKAVTTAKIDDGAVTATQLGAGAVETAKIADANVTYAKLAADAKPVAKSATVETSAWSSKTATVSISDLGANDNIIVTPDPGSFYTWRDCGVYCYSQAENSITLKCETTPSASITVQVLVVR